MRLLERMVAVSQTGLAYTKDAYDRQRYELLLQLAAEMLVTLGGEPSTFVRLYEGDVGYRTPKLDVRALVCRADSVLLVRERTDGRWALPGGWADLGESPAENVVKEIYEETGYRARAVRLLALLDRDKHAHEPFPWHTYKLFFHCEIDGEAASSTLETDAIQFFPLACLPPLSTMRVTEQQIRRLHDMVMQEEGAAWFD